VTLRARFGQYGRELHKSRHGGLHISSGASSSYGDSERRVTTDLQVGQDIVDVPCCFSEEGDDDEVLDDVSDGGDGRSLEAVGSD
jgi:hypothetical protein